MLGVDVSEPALALARENAELNGLDERGLRPRRRLRPPRRPGRGRASGSAWWCSTRRSSPATRKAVEEALRGYRRLQTLALRLLEPDGILVTCCCSGLITMPMLEDLLAQLAAEERRDVQILERRGQAPDHPVR